MSKAVSTDTSGHYPRRVKHGMRIVAARSGATLSTSISPEITKSSLATRAREWPLCVPEWTAMTRVHLRCRENVNQVPLIPQFKGPRHLHLGS